MVDALTIIAGIKQFGLAPDGSDLRDLEAVFAALERQIAELQAERDSWLEASIRQQNRAQAAEAENARLRALPLKDEVERVLLPEGTLAKHGSTITIEFDNAEHALHAFDALEYAMSREPAALGDRP